MVDQPLGVRARVERLLECVEHQIAAHRVARPPADDLARQHIDDEGHEHKASPRRHKGEVGYPQLVRPCRGKSTLNQISRSWSRPIRHGGLERFAAHHAAQAHLSHQSRHGAPSDADVLAVQLLPHLRRAFASSYVEGAIGKSLQIGSTP
jgi:hypothetical protein